MVKHMRAGVRRHVRTHSPGQRLFLFSSWAFSVEKQQQCIKHRRQTYGGKNSTLGEGCNFEMH